MRSSIIVVFRRLTQECIVSPSLSSSEESKVESARSKVGRTRPILGYFGTMPGC